MISKEEYRQKTSTLISEDEEVVYKKKKRAQTIALSTALSIEFAVFLTLILTQPMPFIFIFIGFALMVVTTLIIFIACRFNWQAYKEKYIYGIMALLLEGYTYTYSPKKYIPSQEFRRSPYFSSYDSYHGEDLIAIKIPNDDGTPSDTTFYLCDLDVTETHTDSDGDSHTTTIFNGCFGYIEFPFDFKCQLGINDDIYKKGIKKITLEDVSFNKSFKVYTDNQVEALVILTPSMMQKLKDFKNRTGFFSIALTGNRLYIELCRNLFELKKPKQKFTTEIFDQIYDDVHDILSIVEEIKNNNRVFKM